ncbi:MAG: tyrosine-type recombinase/integrase [Clostridia bacterium]|nr:tyrosine-type recombinase/integrase [Clostridia bacterium]
MILPEQKKLLSVLKNTYYGTLFLVDIFTGMRVGELTGLTWDDIDFDNGRIHINKQIVQSRKKGDPYKFGSPKNGKQELLFQLHVSWKP